MRYFIANWKANKNINETQAWANEFLKLQIPNQDIKIIICPPFPLIFPLKKMLENQKNIYVGCQDISLFEDGTYTGEVTAHSLETLVAFAIIGHSERKKYFHESETNVQTKYALAKKYGIEPIYCVANADILYPPDIKFLCYEPPDAISKGDGRGNFASLDQILAAKQKLHVNSYTKFIYGGSVNKDNATEYLKSGEIDGFLIGGASLEPRHFFQIISATKK